MPRRINKNREDPIIRNKKIVSIVATLIYDSFFKNIHEKPCFEKIKKLSFWNEDFLDEKFFVAYLESRMIYNVDNEFTLVLDYLGNSRKALEKMIELSASGIEYFTEYIILLWLIIFQAHYARVRSHVSFNKAADITCRRLQNKQCHLWEYLSKNIYEYEKMENICDMAYKIKEKIKKDKTPLDTAMIIFLNYVEKDKDIFNLIFDINQ